MTDTDAKSHPYVHHVLLSALFLYSVSSQQTPSLTDSDGENPDYVVGATTRSIGNEDASLDTLDHRVILHPGRWKIRTPESGNPYVVYHFILGFNWTKLQVDYPGCSQVACRGLPDSHRGCDSLCSTGTWRDATIALEAATSAYNRAMASLDATFNDLAALMDTHIVNQHWSVSSDPISKLLSYHGKVSDSQFVDVMRHYRNLIDDALRNVMEHFPNTLSYTTHVNTVVKNSNNNNNNNNLPASESNYKSPFNGLLDTWKSGAFKLAVLLNVVTFAFHGAHQRLQSCALGVQRSDMTGCEPDFIAEFYTDTPVASHSVSSSRLVMIVKRERWNPVTLSHWYMPFLDSSKGNRTCWLDRPMVSDMRANYRAPLCDSRGVCEPLELDNETVTACEVDKNGEMSVACPVVCDTPCFGPICYQPQSGTYTTRAASGAFGVDLDDLVRVTKSPRILSNVHPLSDVDIRASIANVLDRSARSFELLRQGETVLQNVISMNLTARKYIDKLHTETAATATATATEAANSAAIKCVDCERMLGSNRFMAGVSVTFSMLTCPLLIVVMVKLRSQPQVLMRTTTSNRDTTPLL